jgi:hypothetical protein
MPSTRMAAARKSNVEAQSDVNNLLAPWQRLQTQGPTLHPCSPTQFSSYFCFKHNKSLDVCKIHNVLGLLCCANLTSLSSNPPLRYRLRHNVALLTAPLPGVGYGCCLCGNVQILRKSVTASCVGGRWVCSYRTLAASLCMAFRATLPEFTNNTKSITLVLIYF